MALANFGANHITIMQINSAIPASARMKLAGVSANAAASAPNTNSPIHAGDPMTLIEMGGFGAVRKLKGTDPIHRGIDEVIGSPSFLAVNYTDNYHADCALSVLRKRGYGTIGLVGPGSMPLPVQHVAHGTAFPINLATAAEVSGQ